MRVRVSARVEWDRRLEGEVARRAGDAVEQVAQRAAARTKQNIVGNGQVDTGTMLNSVESARVSDHEAEVRVGAEYAIYQEMGTVRMAGRPFLAPAIEAAQEDLRTALRGIL